jgi:hypothetical protein
VGGTAGRGRQARARKGTGAQGKGFGWGVLTRAARATAGLGVAAHSGCHGGRPSTRGHRRAFQKKEEKPRRAGISGSWSRASALHTEPGPLFPRPLPRHYPFSVCFWKNRFLSPASPRLGHEEVPSPSRVAGHPPRAPCRATFAPRWPRARPCPAAPPALASSCAVVTRRLCCETKSDSRAPWQRPRAGGGGRPQPQGHEGRPTPERPRGPEAAFSGDSTAGRYAKPPKGRDAARNNGGRPWGEQLGGAAVAPVPGGIWALAAR